MSRDPRDVKEELIQIYPKKLRQKRSEQIVINEHREDGSVPEIKSNVRSSPGIITQRGCTYAGCKGVVIGPSRDILSITHGPIGCSFYSWLTRRNQTRPHSLEDPNFINYCLSTDMQEENIVFGGEKKLKEAVREAYELFQPQGDRDLLDLPGRTDRRRRACRGPRDEGRARHQRLRLQLRRLPRRQPVGGTPHCQQRRVQERCRD